MSLVNSLSNGVTIDFLNKPRPESKKIVRDIVKNIDEAILSANNLSMNQITFTLENAYTVRGYNNHDATLFVYSEIIEIYKSKGFTDITLMPRKDSCTDLIIKWTGFLTDEEKKRRKDIIDSVSILKKQTYNQNQNNHSKIFNY